RSCPVVGEVFPAVDGVDRYIGGVYVAEPGDKPPQLHGGLAVLLGPVVAAAADRDPVADTEVDVFQAAAAGPAWEAVMHLEVLPGAAALAAVPVPGEHRIPERRRQVQVLRLRT